MKKLLIILTGLIVFISSTNITLAVLCDQKAIEKSASIKTNMKISPEKNCLKIFIQVGCNGGRRLDTKGCWEDYYFLEDNINKKYITDALLNGYKSHFHSDNSSIPDYKGKWEKRLININNKNEIIYIEGENLTGINQEYIMLNNSVGIKKELLYMMLSIIILLILYKKGILNKLIKNIKNKNLKN